MRYFKKNLPIVIAEVGVNFNGSKILLKKMIKNVSQSKADFIKFQLYNTEEICLVNAPSARYQKKINLSQYSMLKKYELNWELLKLILTECKKNKIKPLFSVFDLKSLLILKKIKVKIIKIPSGEIDNYPLLEKIANMNVKIIISSGMSSILEIRNALKILTKKKIKIKNIFLLHCNSEYPSKPKNLNLIKINKYRKLFKCNVGYSDHSEGNLASTIAVSQGAKIIEKHVTLSKNLKGPDHSSSLEIKNLRSFISNLKKIPTILGNSKNVRSIGEEINKKIVRKSIVANYFIKKGEKFSEKNIGYKRPAYGMSPKLHKMVIGKKSMKNFKKNDYVKLK